MTKKQVIDYLKNGGIVRTTGLKYVMVEDRLYYTCAHAEGRWYETPWGVIEEDALTKKTFHKLVLK